MGVLKVNQMADNHRISILALGSYASWKWKRLAEYDDYHLPGNVKPFGFKSDLKGRHIHGHSRVLSEDLDWDPDVEYGNTVEVVAGASSPALMAPSPGEPSHSSSSYMAAAARESVSSFTKLAGRMNFSLTNDVDEANNAHQRSRSGTASSAALMATETAYDPVAQRMADPANNNADNNNNNNNANNHDSEITIAKRPRAASYISITGTGSDRRLSYNHTRDTSYDFYVREQQEKKRASQHISQVSVSSVSSSSPSPSAESSSTTPPTTVPSSRVASDSTASASASAAAMYRLSLNLKNEVDDALSAQFGWGKTTGSRSSSMDSEMASGQPPAIAVTGGAVKQPKNVRDSLVRAPSDGSEQGLVENASSPSPSSSPDPLEDDDAAKETTQQEVEKARNDASRALLGVASQEEAGNSSNSKVVDHPELLRPGRPKSEAIAFVVTPPPKSPELGAGAGAGSSGSRMTWGSAYART